MDGIIAVVTVSRTEGSGELKKNFGQRNKRCRKNISGNKVKGGLKGMSLELGKGFGYKSREPPQ